MSAAGALPRDRGPSFPTCDGCGKPNVKKRVEVKLPDGKTFRLTRTKLTYVPAARDYAWLCVDCRTLNREPVIRDDVPYVPAQLA